MADGCSCTSATNSTNAERRKVVFGNRFSSDRNSGHGNLFWLVLLAQPRFSPTKSVDDGNFLVIKFSMIMRLVWKRNVMLNYVYFF